MNIYGIIGYPLEHSASPQIFAQKFTEEGIDDSEYKKFPLPNIDQLPELIAKNPSLKGLNVTIPYKEMVVAFADKSGELVKETGSANTLKIFRKNGNYEVHAFNTDVYGFGYSLKKHLGRHHRKALILGSGGSSRSVQYALKKMGVDFLVVSRQAKAPGMISYDNLSEGIIQSSKLIINTTPLGMYPKTEAKPEIPYQYLTGDHLLFDLIYNPPMTEFLKSGRKAGAQIINGEEMLRKQAESSWEIWQNQKEISLP